MDDIRNQVTKAYGNEYHQPRKFKNKNENAQEAHEAIRPTYMSTTSVEDEDAAGLYELIWKRTIASQMSDAEFEKTTAKINISSNNETLSANGEVMKFDGFLKVYIEGKDEEDDENTEGMLPPLTVGQATGFYTDDRF
jgi:DNA topoisomerase-1